MVISVGNSNLTVNIQKTENTGLNISENKNTEDLASNTPPPRPSTLDQSLGEQQLQHPHSHPQNQKQKPQTQLQHSQPHQRDKPKPVKSVKKVKMESNHDAGDNTNNVGSNPQTWSSLNSGQLTQDLLKANLASSSPSGAAAGRGAIGGGTGGVLHCPVPRSRREGCGGTTPESVRGAGAAGA